MGDAIHDQEELPRFKTPVIHDNPNGWGPCEMPDQFKDMPYQPFSKGDRLGKVFNFITACLAFILTFPYIMCIISF